MSPYIALKKTYSNTLYSLLLNYVQAIVALFTVHCNYLQFFPPTVFACMHAMVHLTQIWVNQTTFHLIEILIINI